MYSFKESVLVERDLRPLLHHDHELEESDRSFPSHRTSTMHLAHALSSVVARSSDRIRGQRRNALSNLTRGAVQLKHGGGHTHESTQGQQMEAGRLTPLVPAQSEVTADSMLEGDDIQSRRNAYEIFR